MTTTQQFTPGIEKVLEHMRSTEGWRIEMWDECPQIRRDVDGHSACPITSLQGEEAGEFRKVAERFGIDEYELIQIVDTADVFGQYFDPALRAAMLEAGRIET